VTSADTDLLSDVITATSAAAAAVHVTTVTPAVTSLTSDVTSVTAAAAALSADVVTAGPEDAVTGGAVGVDSLTLSSSDDESMYTHRQTDKDRETD